MMASFQEGGVLARFNAPLKESIKRGAKSSLKIFYHSLGYPSLPGLLLDLSFLIALYSSLVIGLHKDSF